MRDKGPSGIVWIAMLPRIIGAMIFLLGAEALFAQSSAQPAVTMAQLEENCLTCHREQKLPDNLIYRRYLLKYSSLRRIEDALVKYLEHPTKERSIMPAEFFLRFPIKYANDLSPAQLRELVRRYIDYYDVRKRLRLEKSN